MIIQWLLASIKANSTLLNWLVWYWNLNWNSTAQVWWNWTDTAITYSAWNWKIIQWAGLNWTTSKIVIPDSASYKVTTWFTINAWIKSSDTTGIGVVFSYLNTDNTTWLPYAWYFLRYQANKLNIIVSKNNSPSWAVDIDVSWTTNICDWTWKMLTVIYDWVNIKTYINGTVETTTAYTSTITYCANNYPRIWSWMTDRLWELQFFNWAIDEVWVWNRGITWTELSELYNAWNWKTHPF